MAVPAVIVTSVVPVIVNVYFESVHEPEFTLFNVIVYVVNDKTNNKYINDISLSIF